MSQPILDLSNSLNWDLVVRKTYQVKWISETQFHAIPDQSFTLDNRLLMVGVKCSKAQETWWLGARLSQRLLTLPSSTSEFVAAVEVCRKRCRLNALTLVEFPMLGVSPYLLIVEFPYWFEDAYLEIWKYSGIDSDSHTEALKRIEEKLNSRQLNVEFIPEG